MSNQNQQRRYGFSILRVALCSILLTALVAACLYVYLTAFDFYHARFLETESKTFAWFTEQIGLALPFVLICLFHYMVYHKHDRRDGDARREMFWELVAVTVLTYGVLLPYLSAVSEALHINALAAGEIIPETDAHVEITLLMETHEWFVRLAIPLGALMVFHAARARREMTCPEVEEPLMTVEEYEAAKAAKAAEDAEAEAAATASISPDMMPDAAVVCEEIAHE